MGEATSTSVFYKHNNLSVSLFEFFIIFLNME